MPVDGNWWRGLSINERLLWVEFCVMLLLLGRVDPFAANEMNFWLRQWACQGNGTATRASTEDKKIRYDKEKYVDRLFCVWWSSIDGGAAAVWVPPSVRCNLWRHKHEPNDTDHRKMKHQQKRIRTTISCLTTTIIGLILVVVSYRTSSGSHSSLTWQSITLLLSIVIHREGSVCFGFSFFFQIHKTCG